MSGSRFTAFIVVMFFLSGFAGLIYESIWSHYLKLYLGHAAYAQTLVLVIFMGGMAIGSYIAAKYSRRWQNLLLAYAAVEGVIGILALIFHESFSLFLYVNYSYIFPLFPVPELVQIFKWFTAALIILPQSVLLGMTFPFLTAGMVRYHPESGARLVALLYFVNSFGASIGVLVSGFLVVDWFGLPGTIKSAGLLNLLIAVAVVYVFRKRFFVETSKVPQVYGGKPSVSLKEIYRDRFLRNLLLVAAGTGAASFIYEISWIRMLSL
ncbi:MAG TPA: hypothetical protein VK999_04980, partial [Methylotenera sp.]|nr:hypothetical protein [Methylotenera sp.]